MKVLLFLFTLFAAVLSLGEIPEFGDRQNKGEIENNSIEEASGIVASSKNQGILWTHNDSGDKNRIFAIGVDGSDKGEYFLKGAENRDWEDIEIGNGPIEGIDYLYIADIGDNQSQYDTKYIYMVEEPIIPENQSNLIDTIDNVSTISFTYPDGNRDAETLLFDPITNDILILSKRDSEIRLYTLPYPQSTTEEIEAVLETTLSFPIDPGFNTPYNYITSGDISTDGSEIIVKTYSNIYYWERDPDKSVGEVLSENEPAVLPFVKSLDETQGEAVCWNNFDDRGYFTLAEEKIVVNNIEFNFPAQLYYYERLQPSNIKGKERWNGFNLKQNFPNPFNPSTKIKYTIPTNSVIARSEATWQSDEITSGNSFPRNDNVNVSVKVYDILGREAATLVNEKQSAGNYEITWDATDFPSGIYFYALKFGEALQIKSMVLIK